MARTRAFFFFYVKRFLRFGEKYYVIPWLFNACLFVFLMFSHTSYFQNSILQYEYIFHTPFDGFVYPIQYVPHPSIYQKNKHKRYEYFASKDFIPVPLYDKNILGRDIVLHKRNSKEYSETLLHRGIYTTPYLGNYTLKDYQEGGGSHPGIDIIAPLGTPVYAIANGIVVKTGNNQNGFGNFIVIRHDGIPYRNTKITIYSVYGHLEKVKVKEGEKVHKNTVIGTVGKTGIATTYHLHFQIDKDTAPFHPYWPFTFEEMRKNKFNIFSAINAGLGRENAMEYTWHPFEILHSFMIEKDKDNVNFLASISASNSKQEAFQEITTDEIESTQTGMGEDEGKSETREIKETHQNATVESTLTGSMVYDTGSIVQGEEKTSFKKKENVLQDNVVIITGNVVVDTDIQVALGGEESLVRNILQTGERKKEDTSNNSHNLVNTQGEQTHAGEEKNMMRENIQHTPIHTGEVSLNTTSTGVPVPRSFSFKDVVPGTLVEEAVMFFVKQGMIHGYSRDRFGVDEFITRKEMVKILYNLFYANKHYQAPMIKKVPFKDIKKGSWEYVYIEKALSLGMISDTRPLFYPNAYVTRAEFMKMLLKRNNTDLSRIISGNTFQDVSPQDWYYPYMVLAQRAKFFQVKDGYIRPNAYVTRGEVVRILYILIKNFGSKK